MAEVNVFDDIYQKNFWNGVESLSGPGSGTAATRLVAPALVDVLEGLRVESVLDVGCGDGFWMPDLPGYVGTDVSAEALHLAGQRHPDREYARLDGRLLTKFGVGSFDAVVCRDVIQHLPTSVGMALADDIRLVARKAFIISTYTDGENVNILAGDCYRPNMEAEPFLCGKPERLIFDGHHYHHTRRPRDRGKHLGVWAVS